jgi:release factor glutamine methyltransferase
VSNPPYIKKDVIPTLQVEVREHEPLQALDGGMDGLEYYRIILRDAQKYLAKSGVLALEIGYDQALDVAQIAKQLHTFDDCKFIKDLAGRDRVLIFS